MKTNQPRSIITGKYPRPVTYCLNHIYPRQPRLISLIVFAFFLSHSSNLETTILSPTTPNPLMLKWLSCFRESYTSAGRSQIIRTSRFSEIQCHLLRDVNPTGTVVKSWSCLGSSKRFSLQLNAGRLLLQPANRPMSNICSFLSSCTSSAPQQYQRKGEGTLRRNSSRRTLNGVVSQSQPALPGLGEIST